MRCYAAAFNLHKSFLAYDASSRVAGTGARHEQLCQLVGEAVVFVR
jgi:hypothetical protein